MPHLTLNTFFFFLTEIISQLPYDLTRSVADDEGLFFLFIDGEVELWNF